MAYNQLISNIKNYIKENGRQEITGQIMQDCLVAIIENLSKYQQFGGMAADVEVPDTENNVFYFAAEGTYPVFGNLEVGKYELAVFINDNGWVKETIVELPEGPQGPVGPEGERGPQAVNPFKGWWPDLATLKAAITATPGDSAYVKDASPATTWSIYVYSSAATSDNHWEDSGTDADTSDVQTFATGEALNETRIINNFTSGGEHNVVSAAASKSFRDNYIKNNYQVTEIESANKKWSSYNVLPTGTKILNLGINIRLYSDATHYTEYGKGMITVEFDTIAFWTIGSGTANFIVNPNTVKDNIAAAAIVTSMISDGNVTEPKLSSDLSRKINLLTGYDLQNTISYTSATAKIFFKNILIKSGEKFKIKVTCSQNWTRFLIFSGESSYSGSAPNIHDDLVNGRLYEFTAEDDITILKGYLVSIPSESTFPMAITIDLITDAYEMTIPDGSVTTNKIAHKAVTAEKIGIIQHGTNLVNPQDQDYKVGKYLTNTGSLSSNNDYITSGFIPVSPNTTYSASSTAQSIIRFSLQYDENKDVIDGTFTSSNRSSITTTSDAAYMRVTMYSYLRSSNYCKPFICEGSVMKPYEDYKEVIQPQYIDVGDMLPKPQFYMPPHIYVAVGRTIELYYDQICLNADRYNIQATCPIGKAMDRKFQIVGDVGHAGNNYTLTINVFNDDMMVLAYGSSTIHIVSDIIESEKKVLPIGDSLTNLKQWLPELNTLNANISAVGTRGTTANPSEGRSGAKVTTYTKVDGSEVYNYDANYIGAHKNAPLFSASNSYQAGDFVKTSYTFGNGQSGYKYWVFMQNHSPGAFDSSEVYCISSGNPFYDYINGVFSMNFYKTFHGFDYDCIIIYLGTNSINLTPETNVNGALGIKNLIDLIRVDEPTMPIVVVNTIFRSSQNGIANQGNDDGYTAQSEYKFNADLKVLRLAKSLNDMVGDYQNVYLCPVGFCHDSKYNYGNTKIAVNPRLSNTDTVYELMPSDSVHPQNSGYLQMADEIFSTLCYLFNS